MISEWFYHNVFLKVVNFQPYYTFHRRHFEELQIGSVILKEYLAVESEKEERIALAKKNEKATHDAIAEKVGFFFWVLSELEIHENRFGVEKYRLS